MPGLDRENTGNDLAESSKREKEYFQRLMIGSAEMWDRLRKKSAAVIIARADLEAMRDRLMDVAMGLRRVDNVASQAIQKEVATLNKVLEVDDEL